MSLRLKAISFMTDITPERLRHIFNYHNDGYLIWKIKPRYNVNIGDKAGWLRPDGYRGIMIDRKSYLSHRLIFCFHFGYFPTRLDHIDGDTGNNKVENLRAVTAEQNNYNAKKPRNNTSGLKGLTYEKRWGGSWYGRVTADGERHIFHNGDKFEVCCFIHSTRNQLHRDYANHG